MAAEHEERSHPSVGEYVEIGVILAVVTAMEVALFYADLARGFTVPALVTLTIIKFALVILWFMHLRFDNRLFRRLFFVGIGLALAVFGAVIAMMFLGGQTGVGVS
jgi:cytochrome c oxidase subunit IV